MSNEAKISPAFDFFFDNSNENDVQEAIVILDIPNNIDDETYSSTIRNIEYQVLTQYAQTTNKMYQFNDTRVDPLEADGLPFFTVPVTTDTLELLSDTPNVAAILPNQTVYTIEPLKSKLPSPKKEEKTQSCTWGLDLLNINTLWETTKGKDISVGVIDTGVYARHPALDNRIREFVFIDPNNRVIRTNEAFDLGFHGTHVCGTIAGQQLDDIAIGIAPEADLFVASLNLGSPHTKLGNVLKAISWLGERGVNIVNMSFGVPIYDPRLPASFEWATRRYDMLFVAAIGNEGYGRTSQPANLANMLAVGAIEQDINNGLRTATFSGGASFQRGNAITLTKPDVVAPGVDIYSCIPIQGGSLLNGTSMATPHVTGVCALLMSAMKAKGMPISTSQIRKVIKSTATHPLGSKHQPDNYSGNGMINPLEALKALSS